MAEPANNPVADDDEVWTKVPVESAAPLSSPATEPAASAAPAAAPADGEEEVWTRTPSWRGYPTVIGSGLAQGAITSVGEAMQGAAELRHPDSENFYTRALNVIDRVDRGESVPGDEDIIGYQKLVKPNGSPDLEHRKQVRADAVTSAGIAKSPEAPAAYDPTKSWLYQTGKEVSEYGERKFPMSQEEKESVTGRFASTVGGMFPFLVAGAVAGPEAGMAIGAALMGSSAAHETAEEARAKGASPEDTWKAAATSAAVNAVVGLAPIHSVLKPIERTMPGIMDWAKARLYRAIQSGAVFSTIGEVQEFLGKEIAQQFYAPYDPNDPTTGYSFDIKRALGSFLGGAFLAQLHPAKYGEAKPAAGEKPAAEGEAPPAEGGETFEDMIGPRPGPPLPPADDTSILPHEPETTGLPRPRGPIEPYAPPESIVNPIDANATPQEKVRQLQELTRENKPLVNDFIKGIDEDFGTKSKSDEKLPENILSKATRPSIVARKPWHDVEHIRDSFRFKTVVDDLRVLPDIVSQLEPAGFEIVKRDVSKTLEPMEWGWRIASFDLRAPNGQLIEYYLPVKELEAAKKAAGHEIFEKWRNVAFESMSADQRAERAVDIQRSKDLYQNAWDASLKRLGIQESDLRASLNAVSTPSREVTGVKSSATSPEVIPGAGLQVPPTRMAANLSPESNTYRTEGSSRDTYAPTGQVAGSSGAGFVGAINRNIGEDGTINKAVPRIPPHRVTAAGGTAIDVAPIVVEASDLITSQDHGYDKRLQPRERDRAAAQAQVRNIASNLDPERLGYSAEADRGAPIVGSDGMVESGNGRVLALRQVYSSNGEQAKAYRDWLSAQGVDVSQYRNPILVRMRLSPMGAGQRQAFTKAANQAATLAMSAPERALSDAGHLTAETLGLIHNPDDLGAVINRPFFRRFVASLPQADQGGMADAKGNLSAEGLGRVRNAILAKAYGDAGLLARVAESTNDEVKSISNALTAAAPQWARMRAAVADGRVRPDVDLTPQLVEAVSRTAEIRSKGIKLPDYLAQLDAFDRPEPEVEDFMKAFYHPVTRRAAASSRIADELRFYAQEAAKVSAEKGLDLGLAPVDGEQITKLMLAKAEREARDELPDRGGAGAGARDEANGREVRGLRPGTEGQLPPQRSADGFEESAIKAQQPTADELRALRGQEVEPRVPSRPISFHAESSAVGKGLESAFGKWKGVAYTNEGGRMAVHAYADTPEAARDAAKQKLLRQFADRADQRRESWANIKRPAVEPGAEGKPQTVIPGAERITTAELLRRRAAEPLRATQPQEIPGGLFGDLLGQTDLLDATRKSPKPAPRPLTSGENLPNLFGEVANAGQRPGPDRGRVRPGTQAVPGAAQPKRPTRTVRPGQLSLFGGETGGAEVRPHDGVPPPGQGPAEALGPTEGDGVTKPPTRGGGTDQARPDLSAPAGELHPAVRGPRVSRPVRQGQQEAEQKVAERSRSNYRITDEDALGEGGPKAKVHQNIDAIRLLKQIEEEGREATPGEKAILVKYTGWGHVAQDMFADTGNREAWKGEREQLRALLTKEEFEAATASTQNAHYTSPDVIRGMWDALDHLGYEGGNTIEPSAGIGHFIGLIPDRVAPKTAWTAVEIEPISARITKALYGGTEVNAHGFEDLKRPPNYYDLAISNVPFGKYNLREKPYGSHPIHNFFFVKSLDKVRPGGVVAFITSRYTMDAPAHAEFRRQLAKTSDLVGAIRLPGGKEGAFADNAGTQVTTDMLFLRKKTPGQDFAGHKWDGLKEIETPEGPVTINEYYADNRHMMLGEMRLIGSQYGPAEPVLIGSPDGLREKIADATTKNMQAGAMTPRIEAATTENISAIDIDTGIKDGAFFLNKDGKLHQRVAGEGVPQEVSPADHARIARLIGLRDLYNKLLGAQLGGEGDKEALRTQLRKAYDDFVKEHGPINKEVRIVTKRLDKAGEPVVITKLPNMRMFKKDPDAWKVASLEIYDNEKGTAKRSDIQNRDVIAAPREREIRGPSDALAASLNDKGVVDLNHIANSLNVDSHDAAVAALGDLVFHDPNGREWKTADEYLSGNVVEKLEEARSIAQSDPSFERNVKALEKVQPEPVTGSQIYAGFGATWIPGDVYESFLEDALGASGVHVQQIPITGEWRVEGDHFAADARVKYIPKDQDGKSRATVREMVSAALNGRSMVIKDAYKDAEGKRHETTNAVATADASNKMEALKEAFTGNLDSGIDDWWSQDQDRRGRLEGIFNRTHNNLAPQEFDGSHLELPGLNPYFNDPTRPYRPNAIWRIIQRGNTLLGHAVGSGKAQPLTAKVLTPDGWRAMGDLRVGDKVIAGDGTVTRITGVFPQGEKEIYSVKFSDGASTECCDEHLWLTQTYRERGYAQKAARIGKEWPRGRGKIRPLSEVRETLLSDHLAAKNHSIPMVGAVSFQCRRTPLDAYLVGVLIGDGCLTMRRVLFSSADNYILSEISGRIPGDCELVHLGNYDYAIAFRGKVARAVGERGSIPSHPVKNALIDLGLFGKRAHEKRVPSLYLFNDIETRIAVLRGLMDTDGTVDARGFGVSFTTTSSELADDVTSLVRSLGGIATIRFREIVGHRRAYTLQIAMPPEINPFSLPRKANRVRPKSRYAPTRYIVDAKPVGKRLAQCIMVEHPSHLYVTDDFIVTHNTVTMIAAGMEQKRLGLINKPAYVVPNHMLEQFSREFLQAYPNAKILVASKDETSADHRKAFLARVASNDWDGVVITHDAFGRINMGQEFRRAFIREQIDEVVQVIRAEVADAGKESTTVKRLEAMKNRLEGRMEKLLNEERKDEGTSFEESGIDHLFVDEAHLFKNLNFFTRLGRIKGLATSDAQRSEDLFLKIRYLEQKRPGRSAVFATGTPISNTMAEAWTMMRYLQMDRLRERGLSNFDDWARTFGRVSTKTETSPDGRTLEEVASMSFGNVPELSALWREVADMKTAAQLKLPTPDMVREDGKAGITTVEATPSDQEEQAMQALVAEAEHMRAHPKRPEPGDRIMLNIVTDGRKVATDGRLLGDFDFNPRGKVALAVGNIHRLWQEGNKDPDAPNKAQMVFLDLGVPKARGGEDRTDLYRDLKDRLVEKGIPAKDIAFIHDANSDDKKARLFANVRSGKVRVIIGSTGKMGMGTNVQDLLFAMHHIDAPWKPAEVEQRDGRIMRQGNLNDKVHVFRYVAKRSFDTFMWQTLERKAAMLNRFLAGGRGSRTMEDVGEVLPEAAELKAAASGDPRIMEHAELNRRVRQLSSQRRTFEQTQQRATYEIGASKSQLKQYENGLPGARLDADLVNDLSGDKFQVDLGNLGQFTNRKEAGEAILTALRALDQKGFYRPSVLKMGRMSGFDMQMEVRTGWDGTLGTVLSAAPSLRGPSGAGYGTASNFVINEHTDGSGIIRRLENVLASIKRNPERLEGLAKSERGTIDRLEKTLGETWPKEKEYRETLAKLDALTKELKAPKHPDVAEMEHEAAYAKLQAEALEGQHEPSDYEGEMARRAPPGWERAEGRHDVGLLGEQGIQLGPKTVAYVSEKYSANERKIADAVQAIGDRMAPQASIYGAKALHMEGSPIWGVFVNSKAFPQTIAWSLERAGKIDEHIEREGPLARVATTVRHEIIHHLKNSGLIRPDEWKALEQAAKDGDWLKKYDIPGRYSHLNEAGQIEEAVADHFGQWGHEREILKQLKDPIQKLVMRAYMRMDLFFRQVAAAARKYLGKDATASDVFSRIETGEVGSRESARIEAQKRYMAEHPEEFAQQMERQTETPEFKRWFGKSKVVDEGGKPLVVYHGTADSIAAFNLEHPHRKDSGWLGNGVYVTSSPDIASSYAALKGGSEHPNVMPLFAKVENPYRATLADKQRLQFVSHNKGAETGRLASDAWTKELKSKGYDGVILDYQPEDVGKANASREIVVFDPTGVKSATGNRGTFNPFDEDVRAQTPGREARERREEEWAERPRENELRPGPAQRIAQSRRLNGFKKAWTSTFQPELVSDRAFEADPLFAMYRTGRANMRDLIFKFMDHDWNYWNKRPSADRLRFVDEIEHGVTPRDPTEANMAKRHRGLIDRNYEAEKRWGSMAGFVQDYFPHIWEKPQDWNELAATRTAQVGPTWFQKERTIDYIKDGLKAGLKLRYDNPVDMLSHRLLSGVDMRLRMELLNNLKKMGLAWEGAQGGDQLVNRGWRAINAPDRKQWVIAPDVQSLWKNAVEAKGFWQDAGMGGRVFRGWMALKNVWVPIKLMWSAFHPLHVLHIDQANSFALAWDKIRKGGDLAGAMKSAAEGALTIPTLSAMHAIRGGKARQAWLKPAGQRSPEEQANVAMMHEGGFRPQISEEMKIGAQKQLAESWQKILRRDAGVSDYRRWTTAAIRHGIELFQKPIFERWIPALKTSAYLNQAAALMQRHPEYVTDEKSRRIALRAIAKSIDNRYGEMNYDTLFLDRYVKDAGVASFLSLGWNFGFVREFGGAAGEAGWHGVEKLLGKQPTANRKVAREASNKMAFAVSYVGTAMLLAGAMTYLMGDKDTPWGGLDFIFPRIGGTNPDGTPRRVSTMFYTREVPMLLKHVQERGGNWLAGAGDMLWDKLMFEPFAELLNNRNYYGYNIWNENAPIYKQAWQGLMHVLSDQFSPITISGARHAAQLSGKEMPSFTEVLKDPSKLAEIATAHGVGLSFLGFGPAPGYVEKTALQNRIGHLYRQYVAPVMRPEEQGENMEAKIAARQAIQNAKRTGDSDALAKATKRGRELGMTPKSIANIGKVPGDVYMFSRLPEEMQKSVLQSASREEWARYWPKAHKTVKHELPGFGMAPRPRAEEPEAPDRASGGAVEEASDEADLGDAPTPKPGQILPTRDDMRSVPVKVARGLGEVTGVSDAIKAARGEMTPEEEQKFALTAAAGLLPGGRGLGPAAALARTIGRKAFGSELHFERARGGPINYSDMGPDPRRDPPPTEEIEEWREEIQRQQGNPIDAPIGPNERGVNPVLGWPHQTRLTQRARGGRVVPPGLSAEYADSLQRWGIFNKSGEMLSSGPTRDQAIEALKPRRAHGGRVEPRNINHAPTEAQKRSGNYAKDHLHWNGLPLTIENARGSVRRGVDKDGKPWSAKLPSHYGYVKGTNGRDGDHVDLYLGPHHKAPMVYVIDQKNLATGHFDEHKAMGGFASKLHAQRTYEQAFSDGKGRHRIGAITAVPIEPFKRWLDEGDTTKPFAGHNGVGAHVNGTHTVISGANSGLDGTVYVDRRIPQKYWRYLAIHETVEAGCMAEGVSYAQAHKVATAAERKAVEADGISWRHYTAVMDGFLAKVENESNTNPPKVKLHVDPAKAIGHHHSRNKRGAS